MPSSSRTEQAGDILSTSQPHTTKHDAFHAVLRGAQERPLIPHLRSDPPTALAEPYSLGEFRAREGREQRKKQLRELWHQLPDLIQEAAAASSDSDAPRLELRDRDDARALRRAYVRELLLSCSYPAGCQPPENIGWKEFKEYALEKEEELWRIFHDELDLDGNGRLDANELALALRTAGIELAPNTLSDFMTYLTASPHSHAISFREFRDFLLLLPRKVSTREIYRYYQVRRFLGDDGRGPARVTMEGDVTLSAEDRPPDQGISGSGGSAVHQPAVHDSHHDGEHEEHSEGHFLEGYTALRYLLAGGVAGAVSRTFTAPFDRLKIFLMTRPPDLGGLRPGVSPGASAIFSAVARIYAEGGVIGFWIGNGLSVAKIFPESAIKFFSYESSKRFFAKYVDHVEDTREISGSSRFISGGIGGITSQLSIYPIETLKTQMMSSTGETKRSLLDASKRVWALGGLKAYYRGLPIGLVGVFPYAAIDMSTFEALKLTYLKSTGKDEPGVLALLMFGSVSGSVGASMVYPLNLCRTRLQASGSSGHPERYTGINDVVIKTYQRDGWRGFYRGLFPTLGKVVPSVSISYIVYEYSKRRLGVS